jgi:hypothetical protein
VASEGSLEAKLDVEIEGEKKSVMIKFVPEGATALSATKASHNNGKRYTIQGMPLEEGKSGKGIYIQEGKKFLRK